VSRSSQNRGEWRIIGNRLFHGPGRKTYCRRRNRHAGGPGKKERRRPIRCRRARPKAGSRRTSPAFAGQHAGTIGVYRLINLTQGARDTRHLLLAAAVPRSTPRRWRRSSSRATTRRRPRLDSGSVAVGNDTGGEKRRSRAVSTCWKKVGQCGRGLDQPRNGLSPPNPRTSGGRRAGGSGTATPRDSDCRALGHANGPIVHIPGSDSSPTTGLIAGSQLDGLWEVYKSTSIILYFKRSPGPT